MSSIRQTAGIRALYATVSAMVLASSSVAWADAAPTPEQPASPAASDAKSASPSIADIIVTGTRIRGVAPVGSTTIQLSRQDLARTGQTSTADMLNNIPAVLSLGTGNSYTGGSDQSTASLNALAFNKSPNLRGFGPQATLSLVNGLRVPYEGANMNAFDGDDIPAQMLQRVEVVADGTSPIYGADAIAGTVNYVMRDPFTGLEAYGQYGHANGQSNSQATIIGGYKWDSGGFIVSYQHTHFDPLRASSRPALYSNDYSPYGGASWSDLSSPGNVVVNGVDYAIPAGQDGQNLTLAQLGAAGIANRQNAFTGYDAIPRSTRDSVAGNFKQTVTDWLELFADGFYSKRDYGMALVSPNTGVTLTIPNSNYYSPCNHSLAGAPAALLAACATGSLTVNYNTLHDSGPARRDGYAESWNVAGGAHITLPGGFKATLSASKGRHNEYSSNTIYFGNSLPFLAGELGGTTAATAFNPFCDSSQASCNSADLNSGIAGAPFVIKNIYQDEDYQANIDGAIFALPGGKVRLAVGAEHYLGHFTNINSFGGQIDRRSINSGYAELYVPIFGPDNAQPMFQSLELEIAGRIDHYSDVGTTKNPKIGFNWTPSAGIKFHGSYGTSFRAPGLADNDPNVQAGYLTPGGFAGTSISPSICPSCASVPGGLTFVQAIGGANGNLNSEHSRSFSLGTDITPPVLKGLSISVNYWNVNYTGQVNTPVYNAGPFQAINQQYYNQYIIYNPALFPTLAANNPVAFFGNFPQINQGNPNCSAVSGKNVTTTTQFEQMLACIDSGGAGGLFGAPASAANTAAVEDGHRLNSGVTKGQGLDLSAHYVWTDRNGTWRVGGTGEYILSWNVAVIGGAPLVNEANHFGYPLSFKGRGEFGWSKPVGPGDLSANVFMNYANSYHIDANQLPGGVSSNYTHISANTTFDLSVTYDTGDRPNVTALRNVTFTISSQNIFNKAPPLVLNQGSTAGIMFDPANASPLGRVIQVQLGKRF